MIRKMLTKWSVKSELYEKLCCERNYSISLKIDIINKFARKGVFFRTKNLKQYYPAFNLN